MPNTSLDDAIKEAYAQAKEDVTIFETLEIVSGIASNERDRIDVAFVLDTSGSMGPEIVWLKEALPNLFTTLQEEFTTVRFALVSFGQTADSGDPILQSGFVSDPSSLVTILDGLSASGSREPVFDTIALALSSLTWSNFYGTFRSVVVITDEDGEESGQTATEASVAASLASQGITLHQTYASSGSSALRNLQVGSNGSFIRRTNEEDFNADTLAALQNVIVVDANLEPIYMVQCPEEKEFTLETGETVTFEPVGFRFQLPGQNDRGVSELNIAIDNVDRRISEFINATQQYEAPILVRYRPYLSTDTSAPQQDPPLELVLSDIQITQFEVTGRATFADIVNLKFLTEVYTRRRFPSLGNT